MDKGANTVGYDIIDHLRGILEEFLKPDAHVRCTGRMSVPLTELLPVKEVSCLCFMGQESLLFITWHMHG